jgi:hypothetical protein
LGGKAAPPHPHLGPHARAAASARRPCPSGNQRAVGLLDRRHGSWLLVDLEGALHCLCVQRTAKQCVPCLVCAYTTGFNRAAHRRWRSAVGQWNRLLTGWVRWMSARRTSQRGLVCTPHRVALRFSFLQTGQSASFSELVLLGCAGVHGACSAGYDETCCACEVEPTEARKLDQEIFLSIMWHDLSSAKRCM